MSMLISIALSLLSSFLKIASCTAGCSSSTNVDMGEETSNLIKTKDFSRFTYRIKTKAKKVL